MDRNLFLVAFISLKEAERASNWLTVDGDPRYHQMDPLDLPDAILKRVYDLYQATYRSLSGRPLLSRREGLLDYNRWVLLTKTAVPARGVPKAKQIVGFAIFKVKDPGLKVGLLGTEGSPDAKRAILAFAISALNTEEVFAEISPPLEDRIRDQVPNVAFADAKKVLAQLGKLDVQKSKGNHYRRKIDRLDVVEKLMVGHPKVPK